MAIHPFFEQFIYDDRLFVALFPLRNTSALRMENHASAKHMHF